MRNDQIHSKEWQMSANSLVIIIMTTKFTPDILKFCKILDDSNVFTPLRYA